MLRCDLNRWYFIVFLLILTAGCKDHNSSNANSKSNTNTIEQVDTCDAFPPEQIEEIERAVANYRSGRKSRPKPKLDASEGRRLSHWPQRHKMEMSAKSTDLSNKESMSIPSEETTLRLYGGLSLQKTKKASRDY